MLKMKGYRQTTEKPGVHVTTHKCSNGHEVEVRTHTVVTARTVRIKGEPLVTKHRTWSRSTIVPASTMK
jgi:hypothetical protein